MDENVEQRAKAARKRRLRWSIAICLVGLSLAAADLGLALWAGYRREVGKPIGPEAAQVVIGADALMLPGIILFAAGFAGIAANAAREKVVGNTPLARDLPHDARAFSCASRCDAPMSRRFEFSLIDVLKTAGGAAAGWALPFSGARLE